VGVDFDTALYFLLAEIRKRNLRKRPGPSFSRFILTGRIPDRGYRTR